MRLIINADDCGYSRTVDCRIENAIIKGRISSTTVMANMGDLEGAARMYQNYHEHISFGFHMNLTEGRPLLKSQVLLDIGFLKEESGDVYFNGSPYRRKFLGKVARKAIFDEVIAQAEMIKDVGIRLSHIDSHHFIHQAFFMLPLLPKLCDVLDVYKVRNYWNYYPSYFNRLVRSEWSRILMMQNRKIRSPKWFSSYEMFYDYNDSNRCLYGENDDVELMVHPGNQIYGREENLLLGLEMEKKCKCKLINYIDF